MEVHSTEASLCCPTDGLLLPSSSASNRWSPPFLSLCCPTDGLLPPSLPLHLPSAFSSFSPLPSSTAPSVTAHRGPALDPPAYRQVSTHPHQQCRLQQAPRDRKREFQAHPGQMHSPGVIPNTPAASCPVREIPPDLLEDPCSATSSCRCSPARATGKRMRGMTREEPERGSNDGDTVVGRRRWQLLSASVSQS